MNRRQFLAVSTATAATASLQGCSSPADAFPVNIKPGFKDSGFDKESTAELVTTDLDLSNKTILVTGCNSGIGYETMRVLAMRGAHVIGTGRTLEKAQKACASVQGKTTPLVMELTDFESIVNCANDLLALNTPLHGLICNAGISGRQKKNLVHGVEEAFLVNYLGHFLFVNKALPAVQAASQSRIIHVSSTAAFTRPTAEGIRFDALTQLDEGGPEYDSWEYYGQSKLANALFSLKLAKKYANTNLTSNALHPGFVYTNISRGQPWYIRAAFTTLGPMITKNVGEGAATTCYAASSPNMNGINGEFLMNSNVVQVSGKHHLENEALADRLWDFSEEYFKDWL